MFRNQKIQKFIAGIVILAMSNMLVYPLTVAAQTRDKLEKAGVIPKVKDEGLVRNVQRYMNTLAGQRAPSRQAVDEQLAQLLDGIHQDLKAAVPEVALSKEAREFAKGKFIKADHAQKAKSIRAKGKQVKTLYAEVEQSFKETEQHLKTAKLPPEILARHENAVLQFESRKTEFDRLIGQLDAADDANGSVERQNALLDLGKFMARHPNGKAHQFTDPNKLPFRAASDKVRAPYTSKEQYQASLFPIQYKKVMLASLSLDGVQLAQATLPPVPDSGDLAANDDVQITQAIKDQAAALGNNPVKIYNWVHNNIAFIPSYGSIQGSDMTLQNRRGNAFDTASLLIALYRSAGIPARYVYGTIEVPAAKVMNWVGGVTKPEAAQSLLGQGGIPNIGLVSGGVVKAIRMEHVWVEAYVDYVPSRGAVNKNPNTWVAVDASFKQYEFTKGLDIKGNVPLSAQNLLDQIKQGATINEAEGSVQNISEANLQAQLNNYQAQIQTYVDSKKTNATLGDVLGVQNIINEDYSILLGTLPYKTITIAKLFQTLPD